MSWWWVERGGGRCGFLRGTVCISAKFVPVIAIVADEIHNFTEGLVPYDVLLERYGSGMGGDSGGGGEGPSCVEVLVSEESSSVNKSESSESDSEESDSSGVSRQGRPSKRGMAMM